MRTTGSFRLFGNIKLRWMPSCAIVRIGETAQCTVATAEFAFLLILAAWAAVIFAAPLAAGGTIVANVPTPAAGNTIRRRTAEQTRRSSTRRHV
jgi:hypothetical protein